MSLNVLYSQARISSGEEARSSDVGKAAMLNPIRWCSPKTKTSTKGEVVLVRFNDRNGVTMHQTERIGSHEE